MKKEKEKKQAPFNFKTWLKGVLQSSSNKNSKAPKVQALFKLLMVECVKSATQIVVESEKALGVNSYAILSGYSTRIKNLLYSPQKDVDIILSLVDSEFVTEEKMEEFCVNLRMLGVNDFYIYALKPTSADLNLIYLLKGV